MPGEIDPISSRVHVNNLPPLPAASKEASPTPSPLPKVTGWRWLVKVIRDFFFGLTSKVSTVAGRVFRFRVKFEKEAKVSGFDSPEGIRASVRSDQLEKDVERQTYYINGKRWQASNLSGDENKQKVDKIAQFKQSLKDAGCSDAEIECVGLFAQQGMAVALSKTIQDRGFAPVGGFQPVPQCYHIIVSSEGLKITSDWVMPMLNVEKMTISHALFGHTEAVIPRGKTLEEAVKECELTYVVSETVPFREEVSAEDVKSIAKSLKVITPKVLRDAEAFLGAPIPPLVHGSVQYTK